MKRRIVFLLFVFLLAGITPVVSSAQALSPQERAVLQAEYDQTLRDIDALQKTIDDLKNQQKTIKGDISLLTAQITQAEKVLKQKNLTIKQLTTDINTKTQKINTLTARIERGKVSLAELLRKTNEIDTYSLPEAVLSNQDVSEFFGDLDTFSSIQRDLYDLFNEIRGVKQETEKEKQALAQKKDQELDAKYVIETKKNEVAANKKEKDQLLAVVDKNKASQDALLAKKQARADAIRAALFNLRDAQGITFEKALQYAEIASQKTGVRTAMILAILSQESDLGKNVGSCYVKDLQTGNGVGKNTGTFFEQVMKSPRDTSVFSEITNVLGLPWETTPVSCPIGGTAYYVGRGFGGAMGPSQFIPSTWELFKSRIAKAVGVSTANPWEPEHAIMATAIYLADLGANGGTYTNERTAACRYYSGKNCYASNGKANVGLTYGNQVIKKAETFQSNIDFLKSV